LNCCLPRLGVCVVSHEFHDSCTCLCRLNRASPRDSCERTHTPHAPHTHAAIGRCEFCMHPLVDVGYRSGGRVSSWWLGLVTGEQRLCVWQHKQSVCAKFYAHTSLPSADATVTCLLRLCVACSLWQSRAKPSVIPRVTSSCVLLHRHDCDPSHTTLGISQSRTSCLCCCIANGTLRLALTSSHATERRRVLGRAAFSRVSRAANPSASHLAFLTAARSLNQVSIAHPLRASTATRLAHLQSLISGNVHLSPPRAAAVAAAACDHTAWELEEKALRRST
jgi:hypothetical protein